MVAIAENLRTLFDLFGGGTGPENVLLGLHQVTKFMPFIPGRQFIANGTT
jgi:hypothetical protein